MKALIIIPMAMALIGLVASDQMMFNIWAAAAVVSATVTAAAGLVLHHMANTASYLESKMNRRRAHGVQDE
jgi:ABC-type enterochelin transport system permease subunit